MDTKAFNALHGDLELPGQSELNPKGFVIFPDWDELKEEDDKNA
jgi:hypothetical protein